MFGDGREAEAGGGGATDLGAGRVTGVRAEEFVLRGLRGDQRGTAIGTAKRVGSVNCQRSLPVAGS